MYGVVGSFLDLQLLSGMAVSRSFDSGISVVEQRSLVNYLKIELKRDVDEYIGKYMHLLGASSELTEKVQYYLMGKKIIDAGKTLPTKKSKRVPVTANDYAEAETYLDNFKQGQEYELIYSMFDRIVENLIDDSPIFIELNQSDLQISGHNLLKKLIVNNSRENKTFNYIVSGTIGNATHFFLLEQQGSDVIVKDSVGSEERVDFFDTFLKFDADVGIKFHRVFDKLQYSSGVCEIYPVIQMLFDTRLRLFNKPYRDSILSSIVEKDGKTRLLGIFTDGLTEASFGTFEGFVGENQPSNSQSSRMLSLGHGGAIYDARHALLDVQKSRVENATKELYSAKEEFKKIFTIQPTAQNPKPDAYLNISLRLLSFLKENKFLVRQKKVDSISKLMLSTTLNIPQNRLELAIGIMLDESDKLIEGGEDLVSKIEEYYIGQHISIQKGDLKSVLELYKSQGFIDRFAKATLDVGMVDFSNPRTYIRAGYAYWKTLEYAEMFDRRVTKHILNSTNFSNETKKAMLSAIYPNNDSFFTIDRGDIYEYINDYYNGVIYQEVVNLLPGSYSYTKSYVGDINGIFTDIVLSQDQLENLPHFIAWNRSFREDIFRHVAIAGDVGFNQRIIPFFFETNEVDKDYVRVVAGKYTFSTIDENDHDTKYGQIGKDFAHMLIIAEGNDRDDIFNTAVEKGKVLLHNNYHFRAGVFNWILNKPTVGIKIKVSSMPVFNYIKNDDKEKDMFIKRLNVERYLSSATTIDINTIKPLTEDMIFVFDTLLNSNNLNHSEHDIDNFAGNLKSRVATLKATLLSNLSSLKDRLQQQSVPQNPGAGQPQHSDEEKAWINFQDKVNEVRQKFQIQNLSSLDELADNI